MDPIYITGHKIPDLDSIVAAIAYADLKKKTDPTRSYVAARAGELNAETKHVLEKYNVPAPELIESVVGKTIILVDHNEKEQAFDDIDQASILEIIDHHRMNFSYSNPIRIIIEPIGSTASVIAKMYKADGLAISPDMAAIMLGAILTDTVITKSPTTTDEDRKIIEELSTTAGIKDWKEYGLEIFKVRSSASDLSDEDIIVADFKDFDIGGKKFGIGQVETVDSSEFENRRPGLLAALAEKKTAGSYHTVVLFVSDVMTENSSFFIASDEPEKVAAAFEQELVNNGFTAKVLSRKKEVVPALAKVFV